MRITDLLKEEAILLNASFQSKAEAIDVLTQLQADVGNVSDREKYRQGILAREADGTTAVGDGIAIPHAIIKEIDEVQLFIVRFRYPIEWESFDDKKVDIAFAIIAPEEKGQEKYLVFLPRLARKLVDEKFIADFRNCRSTEAVYQYVKNELE